MSQLLYGETVSALEAKGDWVRVPPRSRTAFCLESLAGLPGWMRAEDLITTEPPVANAVVRVRQALVHRGSEILTLSVGTRLARVAESSGTATVRLLDESLGEVPSADLYVPPVLPTAASRAEIIRTAELFLGTSYYWGGRSGVQPTPRSESTARASSASPTGSNGRDVPRDAHSRS